LIDSFVVAFSVLDLLRGGIRSFDKDKYSFTILSGQFNERQDAVCPQEGVDSDGIYFKRVFPRIIGFKNAEMCIGVGFCGVRDVSPFYVSNDYQVFFLAYLIVSEYALSPQGPSIS